MLKEQLELLQMLEKIYSREEAKKVIEKTNDIIMLTAQDVNKDMKAEIKKDIDSSINRWGMIISLILTFIAILIAVLALKK